MSILAQAAGNAEAAAELGSWFPVYALVGVLIAVVVGLSIIGRRAGERQALLWPAVGIERISGIPGWAGAMIAFGCWALLTAGVGFYLDVAWHVGRGRDKELFTAPHTAIVIGLGGIALAAAIGIVTATLQRIDTGIRVANLRIPWAAIPVGLLGGCALIGFPLDELWHKAYGVDVTMWSPTHLLMICGAIFSLVAGWLALAEAGVPVRRNGWTRLAYFAAAWLVLAGLTAVLGEFRFGVPQFQQLYHPVLLALACTFTFVAVRLALGPWWSVAVAVTVWLPEVLEIPIISDRTEFVPTRSPGIFIASAVAVELTALVLGVRRRIRFGVAAGLAVATLGFAGEFVWARGAAQPWKAALVPDALIVGGIGAVGAGVLAVGYARAAGRLGTPRLSRPVLAAAAAAVVLALLLPLPRRAPEGIVAAIDVSPTASGDAATVEVTLTPPDAVDGNRWFQVMAWQGNGYDVAELEEIEPGRFVTDHPVPIGGRWKTIVRLHDGAAMLGAPVFLPEDREIDAPEVPAEDRVVELGAEQDLLLREVRPGPATTGIVAYTVIALIAAAWIGAFAFAIRRIGDLGPLVPAPASDAEVRADGRMLHTVGH